MSIEFHFMLLGRLWWFNDWDFPRAEGGQKEPEVEKVIGKRAVNDLPWIRCLVLPCSVLLHGSKQAQGFSLKRFLLGWSH